MPLRTPARRPRSPEVIRAPPRSTDSPWATGSRNRARCATSARLAPTLAYPFGRGFGRFIVEALDQRVQQVRSGPKAFGAQRIRHVAGQIGQDDPPGRRFPGDPPSTSNAAPVRRSTRGPVPARSHREPPPAEFQVRPSCLQAQAAQDQVNGAVATANADVLSRSKIHTPADDGRRALPEHLRAKRPSFARSPRSPEERPARKPGAFI